MRKHHPLTLTLTLRRRPSLGILYYTSLQVSDRLKHVALNEWNDLIQPFQAWSLRFDASSLQLEAAVDAKSAAANFSRVGSKAAVVSFAGTVGEKVSVGAPRRPLYAGRSTGAAPRGPLHGGVVADHFYADVRSILTVLRFTAFQRR